MVPTWQKTAKVKTESKQIPKLLYFQMCCIYERLRQRLRRRRTGERERELQ
jgi:hypothetical protein